MAVSFFLQRRKLNGEKDMSTGVVVEDRFGDDGQVSKDFVSLQWIDLPFRTDGVTHTVWTLTCAQGEEGKRGQRQ